MKKAETGDITALLHEAAQGSRRAERELLRLVHADLRRVIVRRLLVDGSDLSIQPTEVFNELYLKLFGKRPHDYQDRVHFFAMAGRMARQIIVDYARRKYRKKRGGHRVRVELDENLIAPPTQAVDLIDLSEAVEKLSGVNETAARVVELRYFAGLNVRETAEALNVSTATVGRQWRFARAWLWRALHDA